MEYSWLYVVSNSRMPGVYKVGVATDPEERVRQLRSTGTPGYFGIEYLVHTKNAHVMEGRIHHALRDHCTVEDHGPGREWFAQPLEEIVRTVRRWCDESPHVIWQGTRDEWRSLQAKELEDRKRQAVKAARRREKKRQLKSVEWTIRRERKRATAFRAKCIEIGKQADQYFQVARRRERCVDRMPPISISWTYYPQRSFVAASLAAALTAFVYANSAGGTAPLETPLGFFLTSGLLLGWWVSGGLVRSVDVNADERWRCGKKLASYDSQMREICCSIASLVKRDHRLVDPAWNFRWSSDNGGSFPAAHIPALLEKIDQATDSMPEADYDG